MGEYTSNRFIEGKVRQIIVDENGKIVNKYPTKEELKGLEEEPRKSYDTRKMIKYTDKELLEYLRQFYEEYGKHPTEEDFNNNSEYSSYSTYIKRFGNWNSALKLAGLDIDLMGPQGSQYRSRIAEIKVINHFKQHPVDLAGENRISPCDGICPNGKMYDVKSSKFYMKYKYWIFGTDNKYKEEIEIYYFLAFNEDYTKLEYVWRVHGEMIEKNYVKIYRYDNGKEFTVENMKEYDITNKFEKICSIL